MAKLIPLSSKLKPRVKVIGYNMNDDVYVETTIDHRFIITVNGYQWGPPGSKPDKSGAYFDTWDTAEAAITAYQKAQQKNRPII